MPEIQDIVETTEQVDLLLWWQWALIGLAAIVVLSLLIFLFRSKGNKRSSDKTSPLQAALQHLSALNTSNTTSNQLAVQLSIITRQYLQKRFDDPALFETDEEFHARSTELKKLPTGAAKQLQDYLQTVSEHKYAPNPNHPSALDSLIARASSLIQQLDSTSEDQTAK